MEVIGQFFGEYRFLSNFHPANVFLDEVRYPSVEHAYQAAKTIDDTFRSPLLEPGMSPGLAKKYGKNIPLRDDWDDIKLSVMATLIEQKFSHLNQHLADMLLDTGSCELIEGNWWGDTFWGVCDGIGHNHLGKLLMNRRNVLRSEQFYV